MSETLQLEKVIVIREPHHDTPRLLVEWSSRWQDFVSSIGPALSRSESRLAGEAPFGLIPLRIMIPSYVLEAFVIVAAIAIQVKIEQLRPQVLPRITSHDVIYYSGDELPRTEDLGGAETGRSGRAGGDEARHRTQTIKVSRGGSLMPKVVDAPNLKLPSSRDAVANLLAVRPDPGPPPAEGLRSARSAPNLTASVVAPAPNVIRDYTRNGVQLDSVISPAPTITRDRTLTAPTLNPALIAPAPEITGSHTLVAPALAPAVIPPAPKVSRDRNPNAPAFSPQVVAPAPSVSREQVRSAPGLTASVIPPAPGSVARQLTSAPVQSMNAAVIPPPVSAPERADARASRVTLPAPSVVAPPPSADISRDMRRLAGGNEGDPGRTVVPPPPSQSGSGSFMSGIIGKIFGPSEVVPPPPSATSQGASGGRAPSLAANVVAPPPSVTANTAAGMPRGLHEGSGASLGSNVVAPPPSVGVRAGSGSASRWSAPQMGSPNVVPPPPSLSGAGGGTGATPGGVGAHGGSLLANNVVPPPPSVGGGSSANGSGSGRQGIGLGAPLEAGAALAAAHSGGAGSNAGAVISTQPGTKVGVPTTGGAGSLAMSPAGADKSGLGGSGGGTGISRGDGSGSALAGNSTGAATLGAGRGADPNARGGTSTHSGPGGAGSAPAGTPPVRGVEISGGSSIVTLPGFGSDPAANDPAASRRTATKKSQALNVTVVATATSGGAFEPYKSLLRNEKSTAYFDTSLGTAVMEFSDNAPAGHTFRGALSAPFPITDLPQRIPHGRMVVTCVVDATGNITNVRVLEAGPALMTAKLVAALRSWKFQPAMRNEQPVEVTAILGFGINTDDRF
ncbi:MAG TPA: TonB family protein [Candidatus Sulfotelmatobacter sp.]|nr:TonB family protein [Candidatus Sulfotelmatobacter sp.]